MIGRRRRGGREVPLFCFCNIVRFPGLLCYVIATIFLYLLIIKGKLMNMDASVIKKS